MGKILCKLGIHKWHKVRRIYKWKGLTPYKRYETRCKRCDKLNRKEI